MIGLLHGELIKLRTTRTALGFAGVALLLVVLSLVLLVVVSGPTTAQDKLTSISVAGQIAFVLTIFGAVGATGEHRHGTITSALLIAPDRVRVTVAKLLAYTAAGALLGLLLQLVALIIGLPLISGDPGADPSVGQIAGLIAGSVVGCALLTAFGVAIGSLVRNQVMAVVGLLVYLFIIEPLLGVAWHGVDVAGLSAASNALTGADPSADLSPVVAGLALLAWTVVAAALAVVADRVRDVS